MKKLNGKLGFNGSFKYCSLQLGRLLADDNVLVGQIEDAGETK